MKRGRKPKPKEQLRKLLVVTIDPKLYKKIEEERGLVNRSAFIESKLKEVLR